MPEDWHKIERGLFESSDGRFRIANPYKLTTELRHRWLVAERRTSGGWCMHDGDHATLHEARAYVEGLTDDQAATAESITSRPLASPSPPPSRPRIGPEDVRSVQVKGREWTRR